MLSGTRRRSPRQGASDRRSSPRSRAPRTASPSRRLTSAAGYHHLDHPDHTVIWSTRATVHGSHCYLVNSRHRTRITLLSGQLETPYTDHAVIWSTRGTIHGSHPLSGRLEAPYTDHTRYLVNSRHRTRITPVIWST